MVEINSENCKFSIFGGSFVSILRSNTLISILTLIQVHSENGRVKTSRNAAHRVRMRAHNPGPSGSAEERNSIHRIIFLKKLKTQTLMQLFLPNQTSDGLRMSVSSMALNFSVDVT